VDANHIRVLNLCIGIILTRCCLCRGFLVKNGVVGLRIVRICDQGVENCAPFIVTLLHIIASGGLCLILRVPLLSHTDRVIIVLKGVSCGLEMARLQASQLTQCAINGTRFMHDAESLSCVGIREIDSLTIVLLLR